MLDVAIVGGGLCGLAVAHSMQAAKSVQWQLFESRPRLGGRILTETTRDSTPVDMGATWFWPHNQPSITRLIRDLGLTSFPQTDDGRVLHLHDPNEPARTVALTPTMQPAENEGVAPIPNGVHGGAYRVQGGMTQVITALARRLHADKISTDTTVESITDLGGHVQLTIRQQGQRTQVYARRVVLALPPRVADATIRFAPTLPPSLQTAMRATPTWMATAAKAGFSFQRAFWRDAGHTGNAWVTHSQAMLAEVFDASGPADSYAGLAGFAALSASQRPAFERGRDLLLESQLVQLFGQDAADTGMCTGKHWHDWATEPQTCSPLDIEEEDLGLSGQHPPYGNPLLTTPHWEGRLLFGGTETAQRGGGYLDGALVAAARLRQTLLGTQPALAFPTQAANDARSNHETPA